jgi:predicted RNA binding protein with dsRBD fold (UPF0201 family)
MHDAFMLTVTVSAPLRPTEDRDKVVSALRVIFPEGNVEVAEDKVRVSSDSLDNFSEMVRRQRILDATRATMRRFARGASTCFTLNKQAAAVGRISFEEGRQPLGGISISVEAGDEAELEATIDKVAPRTVDGEVPA